MLKAVGVSIDSNVDGIYSSARSLDLLAVCGVMWCSF